ncbi:MAG TPA: alkene reductase [Stellaceae bacterium]|nr:alkene reductase [Stellaceae bacterium]
MQELLRPITVGRHRLRNRIVMAPMQRARNDADRVPTPMMAEYYVQRSSVGLQITEASSVSPLSVGRPGAAAIFRPAQAEGWRRIAQAVHAQGGLLFQQLYHLGRKSDPSRMPDGAIPVAPSAIAAHGQVAGANGPTPFAVPRALETGEIAGVVTEFARAAANARAAGMDGIEVHGANGYLLDQFLRDGTNRRTDRYGGSAANRARLLFEVVEAAIGAFGKDSVGVRISPHFRGDGIGDSDPAGTFGHVAAELGRMGIAYLHLVEAVTPGLPQSPPEGMPPLAAWLRRAFGGPLMVNGGYTRESAEAAIVEQRADLVSFAALVIANPDLPERFRRGAPLNAPDRASFYDGDAKGYIDYPALDAAVPLAGA